jgi:KaiC/GvpD/RAD55 family RecA-like ATPase
MRTLTHVLAGESGSGGALPDLHPALTKAGIKLRKNSVTMVVAQPNGGKSAWSLHYAITSGVRTLYISADTDAKTTLLRSAAIILNRTVDSIEEQMEAGEKSEVHDALYDLEERIRFDFSPSPTLEDIALEVEAYLELYAEYPTLLVVDNLMNLVGGGDGEWSAMREAMVAMHHLARTTEACVLVLHHVSENDSKSVYPAPRRAIQGKVSQLPEQILSVALDPNEDEFRVAAVKNRHGKHDASGYNWVGIPVDLSRMKFFESVQDLQLAQKRSEWT